MKKGLIYIIKIPFRIIRTLIIQLPYFAFIRHRNESQPLIKFSDWFVQKVINIGGNRKAYWPTHFTSTVINPRNIILGVGTYPGLMGGCYIQGIGKIFIGDYTLLAANTCIISARTDPYDARKYFPIDVKIGKYCWIGAGAIILPGVELGDFTIVGAGAVVTNSFPEGYCVIAGNPATKLKDIEKNKCIPYRNANEYIGYVRSDKFKANAKKYINLP